MNGTSSKIFLGAVTTSYFVPFWDEVGGRDGRGEEGWMDGKSIV